MRKLLLSLFGILTSFTGLLILIPSQEQTKTLQIVLNEVPWLPTAAGAATAIMSNRRRNPLAWAFGLFGAILALVPLTQIRRTLTDMQQAMHEGFGVDYEMQLPAEVRVRLSTKHLSLLTTLGLTATPQVKVTANIPYLERPTRILKFDVYQPRLPPAVGDRYPVVLALHGGGWNSGDKGEYFAAHHRHLAAQGYVVFDVQYRFVQEAAWSAQLDDAREAVRWVKAHADDYHIDPTKIVLLGRSAGGQIALSTAYRAINEHADTAVCGVVGIYAPTNLRLTGATHDDRVIALCGGKSYEVPEMYADASPLDFAQGEHLPPTLLLHGYMDDVVGPVHSELLLNKLKINQTPAAVLRIPWARHGFDAVTIGTGAQITTYYLDRFLAWCVYR